MVFGTFDLVHLGHLNFFAKAKKLGDKLVVVVARDENVIANKGFAPFNNQKDRAIFIRDIKTVDEVIIGDKKNPYKVIKKIKPDIIALGYDQKFFIDGLEEKIRKFGLKTKIIRMKSFLPEKFKSELLRKHCGI